MAAINRNALSHRIWQNRHFYLFISPFFVLFAVFGFYPLLYSLYLSFTKFDGLTPPLHVGFENFVSLYQDEEFFTSLWNTLVMGAIYIPPMFIFAFLFANILNNTRLRGLGLFRMAIFVPCITPMVVIAIVFSLLFSTQNGLLNWIWSGLTWPLPGGPYAPIKWIESAEWSKISVSIVLVWRWTGYNMVLMLAGLQGIPKDYYEAATIDGATRWQQMYSITMPLMRPTFVFCTIMSIIGTTYMFEEVFVMTLGGPGTSSTNFGVFLFNTAFTDFRFGYASCAAYVVAVMVFILSLIVLRWRRLDA